MVTGQQRAPKVSCESALAGQGPLVTGPTAQPQRWAAPGTRGAPHCPSSLTCLVPRWCSPHTSGLPLPTFYVSMVALRLSLIFSLMYLFYFFLELLSCTDRAPTQSSCLSFPGCSDYGCAPLRPTHCPPTSNPTVCASKQPSRGFLKVPRGVQPSPELPATPGLRALPGLLPALDTKPALWPRASRMHAHMCTHVHTDVHTHRVSSRALCPEPLLPRRARASSHGVLADLRVKSRLCYRLERPLHLAPGSQCKP